METTDWIVIVVFAILGYGIVSWLIDQYEETKRANKQDGKYQHDYNSQSDAKQQSRNAFEEKSNANKRWHEILEVDESASLAEVKSAYRKKIQQYHPDRLVGMASELNEIALKKAQIINAAYDEAIRLKS